MDQPARVYKHYGLTLFLTDSNTQQYVIVWLSASRMI